jgi:hypothetical protein
MDTLAAILSYASGLVLMGYQLRPAELIGTSLAVNATLGPLTAVIASRRGRNSILWTALGFTLGMWALAAVLIMRPSSGKPGRDSGPSFPPTSRAA